MKKFLLIATFFLLCFSFYAQISDEDVAVEEDVGFDFNETTSDKANLSLNIGGVIYTGIRVFFDEFKKIQNIRLSSLVWGSLKLEANSPLTYALFSVNLNDKTLPINLGCTLSKEPIIPLWIDEAFLQINVGSFYFLGGLKKLNWGRSDLFSVLDVVNPIDETANFDIEEKKRIAVPMFQFVMYFPYDLKLEGVFLPMFIPSFFALEGRWKPYYVYEIEEIIGINETKKLQKTLNKDTTKLSYAHGGIRFTTTIALAHDLGFQYFYGYSKKPIINIPTFEIYYPSFHNIGIDYGTVLGPINLRMEFCANIMGDDRIRNSNIAWNVGFDFSLKYNLALNVILKETFYFNQIEDACFALFRSNNKTDTIIFLSLSQSILRGAMEWKIAFIAGFEDVEFAVMPSLHFIFGTIILDTKVGIFLGKNMGGRYSQYKKNNFIKLSLGYEF